MRFLSINSYNLIGTFHLFRMLSLQIQMSIKCINYYTTSCVMRAFLIAQLVKNLPAKQETLVRFLGGRSAGEGIGYPFQYSWETVIQSL